MLKLYWCCMDMSEADQKFVEDSLDEFKQLLKSPPMEVELKAFPLAKDIVSIVSAELSKPSKEKEKPFDAYRLAIRKKMPFDKWTPLLVYCKPNTVIVQAAKKQAKDEGEVCPNWGYNISRLSAVYNLVNKYILWHEALHLWGADDCHYRGNPGPTCGLSNCIMQYKPTKDTVRQWPFLCQKNIELIQERSKKHNLDDSGGRK